MSNTTKHYAKRDPDAQGIHYINHVSAMTTEGLHAKSAIAAELAHRDIEIERLRAALASPAQAGEYPPLVCDYCGALTPDPWHSSGMLHGKMSKHIHSCDACAAQGAAQSAPVDAALIEFIEKCGEVCFQRVREGFKGPMRWDIEFIVPGGDREVRGKTLSDAITKAIAARAAQEGKHD